MIGAAVSGASGLVFLMASQRALNFVLNQLLIRAVDPEIFGLASIQLDLMLQTSLFLSREGFRLSLSRIHINKNKNEKCEIVESTTKVASGTYELVYVKIPGRIQIDLYNYFFYKLSKLFSNFFMITNNLNNKYQINY